MVEDINLGHGEKASERQVMKWFKLAWKSAEKEPFTWKDLLFIIIIVLGVINIIVSGVVH